MNKWKITAIICIILLIASAGFFSYSYVSSSNYNDGFRDGNEIGKTNIIAQINNQGKIPIIQGQGNQSQINWIDINQICSGR